MKHGSNRNRKSQEPCVTSSCAERYVTNITDGTMIGYKYYDFTGEVKLSVTYRGASGNLTAMTELGDSVASIELRESKEWSRSDMVIVDTIGVLPLYLEFHGKGSIDILEVSFDKM